MKIAASNSVCATAKSRASTIFAEEAPGCRPRPRGYLGYLGPLLRTYLEFEAARMRGADSPSAMQSTSRQLDNNRGRREYRGVNQQARTSFVGALVGVVRAGAQLVVRPWEWVVSITVRRPRRRCGEIGDLRRGITRTRRRATTSASQRSTSGGELDGVHRPRASRDARPGRSGNQGTSTPPRGSIVCSRRR